MKDFKFKYCICDIKHVFDENIKKSKLFIDKNTRIKIEFDDDNNIIININDFHKFIEFVIDNDLICKKSSDNHYYTRFDEYLNYIFKNNLLDHIKSPIIKKYVKFMKTHHNNNYYDYKYSNIINKACRYSSFETIKITMKLTSVKDFEDVILYVCQRNDEAFLKIFKFVVDLFCEKLANYFEHYTANYNNCDMNYCYVLQNIAGTNNLQVFNYFVNQVDFTINSIDNTKLKPKYLDIYDKLLESYNYSQNMRNNLLCHCIYNEKLIIVDQLILDGADINKFDKHNINHLFKNKSINSIDFIIEKGLLNKDQINDRFKKSYKYGPKVAEVLVSNGVDYELYIDELLVKTKNNKNKDFYYYLKELKNQ
ncbi:hypothetical protein QLL95_gp0466 [Cotonvirus japonicus]|uniref:Ankyrin repeat protein n=1 Tax=Cotonvirus japonicus TaxID=2811091 RepID=A0ABM7NUB8_9VIRU|nr:hypothetical protein QLL95_gp0466 [Cotonvirus japonicus]BCS83657.1 hypothetical protein [Cotonvirus japonicus]